MEEGIYERCRFRKTLVVNEDLNVPQPWLDCSLSTRMKTITPELLSCRLAAHRVLIKTSTAVSHLTVGILLQTVKQQIISSSLSF